ncbi:hypothetical protein EYC80_001254 [Monilinia laxa]|uniref:Uncharacterized protein n=1 Tax=Monilinia laxa TaxID=61186 RepID=A0A5N6K8R5_MONLA|nr:hypothetical protein EYC80_001254 [Monilinia laxa]
MVFYIRFFFGGWGAQSELWSYTEKGSFAKKVFCSSNFQDGRSFDKRKISISHYLLGMECRNTVPVAKQLGRINS